MKKLLCLLMVSIIAYSSVEIYYSAKIKYLSFELQRLENQSVIVQQQTDQKINYKQVYRSAINNLGMKKTRPSQLKKL